MTLMTPSPSTNPLAIIMISIFPEPASFFPPVLLRLRAIERLYQISTIPPINLAMEKFGVFRNPMANATPLGIQLTQGESVAVARTLTAATQTAISPNQNINSALLGGKEPLRSRRAKLSHTYAVGVGNIGEGMEYARAYSRYAVALTKMESVDPRSWP